MATLPAIGPVMTRNMHQKITCRAQILTPTSAGEQQESWQDIATVWAAITPKSSAITQTARQNHIATTYKVRVRYQDKLRDTRNILWQGQELRVLSLRDPGNQNRILEFDVVENKP